VWPDSSHGVAGRFRGRAGANAEVWVAEVADTGAPAAFGYGNAGNAPLARKSEDVASQTAAAETSTCVRRLGQKAPP
jgi:hypothetical protein